MTDISRHPLLQQAYDVCQAIEACGASVQLTQAVCKASVLLQALDQHIKSDPPGTIAFKVDIDSTGIDEAIGKAETLHRLTSSYVLDPLEQAIDQAARLVADAEGELAIKLSRHLDALLAKQLLQVSGR
ncbi:hypothetical protein [Pseudomonas petrae]|uniref:hypothetical protein n=1 Tax=Pseudomonas petrae TaxID=2912190 RepID=UPI001F2A4EFD|nr:hypothetical protein [Pseudomonas petrae]MCF7557759.1 hypothetical protein [Pseudomonas petrae]